MQHLTGHTIEDWGPETQGKHRPCIPVLHMVPSRVRNSPQPGGASPSLARERTRQPAHALGRVSSVTPSSSHPVMRSYGWS